MTNEEVMDNDNASQTELADIVGKFRRLVTEAARVTGVDADRVLEWDHRAADILERLAGEKLRVAVVGPIKSGKSTVVNSLFGGDFLRRGAGVVTAIVTRIHAGGGPSARLEVKSWDQVNAEARRELALFPDMDPGSAERFDIRRDQDRELVTTALAGLGVDRRVGEDALDGGMVLLQLFLAGYDEARKFVGEEPSILSFEGAEFEGHKAFSGEDRLAVYLTDMSLTLPAADMDSGVEIADCQGSDSPNPHHLTMIQSYLRTAHLIVYVISSRMGVRRADIRFLTALRKMGLMDQAVFLVNVDVSEHDGLADLDRVTGKIRSDLSAFTPSPDLFVFSALYNLFQADMEKLQARDRLRLAQWKSETELSGRSDAETARFLGRIRDKLSRERRELMLSAHLGRLSAMRAALAHHLELRRDLLSRDLSAAGDITARLRDHGRKVEHVRSVVKGALDGSLARLTIQLKRDVDRLMDFRDGLAGESLRNMRSHAVDPAVVTPRLAAGFSRALLAAHQDLRRAVDTHLAENVNPEVVRFAAEKEREIAAFFEDVARPFEVMVTDALAAYNDTLASFGISALNAEDGPPPRPDMARIREAMGLKPPLTGPEMTHGRAAHAEAWAAWACTKSSGGSSACSANPPGSGRIPASRPSRTAWNASSMN